MERVSAVRQLEGPDAVRRKLTPADDRPRPVETEAVQFRIKRRLTPKKAGRDSMAGGGCAGSAQVCCVEISRKSLHS